MYLGAHVSIAENIALAPERGKDVGAEAIQIFSRSPRMLRKTKPLTPEETQGFRENLVKHEIARAIIHANYLINLGAPDENTINYSRVAFVEELERAQALGVHDVIFHPGSHGGKGDEYAIRTTASSIDWAIEHAEAPDVFADLENMAGQGNVIGHKFEQLADVIKASAHSERVGVCIDTCHTFAAGYDFRARDGYDRLMDNVDQTVGLRRIRAFHLNDSRGDLGSRWDRHEDIGKGKLGKPAFGFLVNDERFREIPGCLEFPGEYEGYRQNLKTLRSLVKGPSAPTSKKGPGGKRGGRGTE
ncbi:MAG TPA: deoxyribonuclease IV [Thermoplasmata archaeon]|nr:deoxyribonuclease IV [Thermoplasmata archaeon]